MELEFRNNALMDWFRALLAGAQPTSRADQFQAPEIPIAEPEPFPMRVPVAEEPPVTVAPLSRTMVTGDNARLFIPGPPRPSTGQMITGDTARTFEGAREYQIPAPRQQVIQPQASLPPIFEALKPLMSAASKITGYDPTNPPQVHTLSQPQVMALNPIMFEQYKAATIQRKQKIDAARDQYERLLDLGQKATANKFLQDNQARAREDENATTDYAASMATKESADAAYQSALDKETAWKNDRASAIASGKVKVGRDGSLEPGMAAEPELKKAYARRVEDLTKAKNAVSAELEKSGLAKSEADAEFKESRTRVAKLRKSTTANRPAAQPALPQAQSTGKVTVISPQGVPGTIPAINLPKALQRGYKLAQ